MKKDYPSESYRFTILKFSRGPEANILYTKIHSLITAFKIRIYESTSKK